MRQLITKQKSYLERIDLLTTSTDNLDKDIINLFVNSKTKIYNFKTQNIYQFSFSIFKWLNENLKNYDCIHIHGLYRFPCDAALIISAIKKYPVIFSPHGALDPYLYKKSDHKLPGLIC